MNTRALQVPVTVLIPTYERAAFIGEAVASIVAQSATPAEIIVIDDGSTQDLVPALAAFGNLVRVLRQDNAGKAAALNHGLLHATQPYIWIFDDDDIAAPDGLRRLFEALVADPMAAFSYGLSDTFDASHGGRQLNACYLATTHQALKVRLLETPFIWQGALLVRRSAYDRVGLFDAGLLRAQDYDMILRLSRFQTGIPVPAVIFHYRRHAGLRGPGSARLASPRAVQDAWTRYHRTILRSARDRYAIDEFAVPGPERGETAAIAFTGLLQRGCLMAANGLWSMAIVDFEAASAHATSLGLRRLTDQERHALRGIFDYPNRRSRFDALTEMRRFFAALSGFPAELRELILFNLFCTLPFRRRLLRASRDGIVEAVHLIWLCGFLLRPMRLWRHIRGSEQPIRLPWLKLLEQQDEAADLDWHGKCSASTARSLDQ